MIDFKEFYRGFQINYFDYKILRLNDELEKFQEKNHELYEKGIFDYNREDHIRSIKIDIRQTYFQAVETVFELLFAFKTTKNNQVNELDILINLSKRKDTYADIRKISKGEGGMDSLNKLVTLSNGKEITLLQYIFYLGAEESRYPGITESVVNLPYCLRILARDLDDRREYNAYKHGLRNFRALNKFQVHDAGNKEILIDFNLEDSMTFMDINDKQGQIELITKVFDSKRDVKMTILCGYLLSNIINLRRVKLLSEEKEIPIFIFTRDLIDTCNKTNINVTDLKFTHSRSALPSD